MATSYLYGDSTPSPLTSNFIELLRDALDLSVFVLLSDARIGKCRAQAAVARRAADDELGRLRGLGASVLRSIGEAAKGEPESPTAHAAASIARMVGETIREQETATERGLAARITKIDAQEATERQGYVSALETFLLRHDPPDASTTLRLAQTGASYAATLEGTTPFGLEYTLALDVAPSHVFGHVVRVEKLVAHLEVMAPESAGWIRKETKLRPQRLERYYVAGLVVAGAVSTVMLRAESDGKGAGFEVTLGTEERRVQFARAGGGNDGADASIEISDEDAEKLVALHEALRLASAELAQARRSLVSATLDGPPFLEHAQPKVLVERLVRAMAPIAQEIARRSFTPSELVLKRLVAGDRREEIFVAKSSLIEKLAPLPDVTRAIFLPLGLEAAAPPPPSSSAAPPPPEPTPTSPDPAPEAPAAPPLATAREQMPSSDVLIEIEAPVAREPTVIVDESAYDEEARPTRSSDP